jgi:protein-tyrosine phosphatase
MTPADQAKLTALGVRYEIDLRSESERTSQPSRWGAQVPAVIIPFHYPDAGNGSVSAVGSRVVAPTATVAEVSGILSKAYVDISLNRAGEIGTVLHDLTTEDAPALLHCTGGKDRTGVTVAVLMTLIGAPHDAIYTEYLKSNDPLVGWYEQKKAKAKADNQPFNLSFELFKAQSGADPAWLDNAFAAIDSQYGSFDRYISDGLKLSPQDVTRLKTRFLE